MLQTYCDDTSKHPRQNIPVWHNIIISLPSLTIKFIFKLKKKLKNKCRCITNSSLASLKIQNFLKSEFKRTFMEWYI